MSSKRLLTIIASTFLSLCLLIYTLRPAKPTTAATPNARKGKRRWNVLVSIPSSLTIGTKVVSKKPPSSS